MMGRTFLSVQLAFAFGLLVSVLVVARTGLQPDELQARGGTERPAVEDGRAAGRSQEPWSGPDACAHSTDGLLIGGEIVVARDVLDPLLSEPGRTASRPSAGRRVPADDAAAGAEAACPRPARPQVRA
jgi:hypothetical protein